MLVPVAMNQVSVSTTLEAPGSLCVRSQLWRHTTTADGHCLCLLFMLVICLECWVHCFGLLTLLEIGRLDVQQLSVSSSMYLCSQPVTRWTPLQFSFGASFYLFAHVAMSRRALIHFLLGEIIHFASLVMFPRVLFADRVYWQV